MWAFIRAHAGALGARAMSAGLLFAVACGPAAADRSENADTAVREPIQAETLADWTFSKDTPETLRSRVLGDPAPDAEATEDAPDAEAAEDAPDAEAAEDAPDAEAAEEEIEWEVLDALGPDTAWVTNRQVVWTRSQEGARAEVYRSGDIGYLYSGADLGLINGDTLIDLMWEVWGTDAGGMVLFGREGEPEVALATGSCTGVVLKDVNGDGLVDVQIHEGIVDPWSCSDLLFIACFDDYSIPLLPVFYVQTEDGFAVDTVSTGALFAPYAARLREAKARLQEGWPENPDDFEADCDVDALIAELEAQAVRAERLSNPHPPS